MFSNWYWQSHGILARAVSWTPMSSTWWLGSKGQCPKRLSKNQAEGISSIITQTQSHAVSVVVHFINKVPLTFKWRENRLYLLIWEWQGSENISVKQEILLWPFSENTFCQSLLTSFEEYKLESSLWFTTNHTSFCSSLSQQVINHKYFSFTLE